MEVNYTYFEISTGDIWEHERSKFLNGNCSEEFAHKLIHDIRLLIEPNTEPVYNSELESNDEYFQKKVDRYLNVATNLEELYALDYFIGYDGIYQYDYDVILGKETSDFEYWFNLKLRQYEDKILLIDEFLSFQLEKSFENKVDEFIKFLKMSIRQFEGEFFTKKVSDTVKDWIEGSANQIEEPKVKNKAPIRSNKRERKMQEDFDSFLLKAFIENPKYFIINANEQMEVLLQLKKNGFIDQAITPSQFQSIFQNKSISTKKQIIWQGSVKELQWFVKYLVYDSKKVVDLKNDIWLVTAKCFSHKNGTEYSDTQLRNASGKRIQRKELLESILENL